MDKKQQAAKIGKLFGELASELGKVAADASVKAADAAGKAITGAAEVVKKTNGKEIVEASEKILNSAGKAAAGATEKAADIVVKAKDSVTNAMDVNGDGKVDIEDVIIMSLRVPGIRVSRSDFLRAEFTKRYPKETIDDAIAFNPAHAKIPAEDIDHIADDVIRFERNCVSGISAALGMPGGMAMAATIPADIAQYYEYMLRAAQKLMYLYGFPEINTVERGQTFDSETINILILCLGAMYGAAGANNAIKAMARALANGVEKKLMKAALTKGTIYPIVKSVAGWFGKKMTKEVFAGFFKKAIPVVGGVVGGAITFASFKPCCDKLKSSLQDTLLSNPQHIVTEEEKAIIIVESEENED